ncbi:MAG: hypothetical protein AAGD40_06900 [Pseudomonadota bacterium]
MAVKRLCILLSASIAFCSPSLAQTDVDDEIVVTGMPYEERLEAAVQYVKSAGVARAHRQAARWEEPVCVEAMGLGDEHNDLVETWAREAGIRADVPLADKSCEPNVVVMFAENGVDLLNKIRRKAPRQFAKMRRAVRERMMNEPAPVRSWYQSELRGRHGERMFYAQPLFASPGEGSLAGVSTPIPYGDSPDSGFMMGMSTSRLGADTQRALRSAAIVIDVNEAHGKPLVSVARYAAFLAFAEMHPQEGPHPHSILGLFDEQVAPDDTMTQWTDMDLMFMKELYSMPLAKKARQQRRMLANAMMGDLEPED